jgi:hypothetical protein
MTTRYFTMLCYNEEELKELARRHCRKGCVTWVWWEELCRRDGTRRGGRAVVVRRRATPEDRKESAFLRRDDVIKQLLRDALGRQRKEMTQ